MAEYLSDASGRRVAGVRPGVVLVVGGDDAATTVGELWPALSADATTAVVERLTARGLGNTPDFALITWPERAVAGGLVRVLVRGDFEVAVGGTRISGVGVSTWTERVLDVPAEFEVEALGADAAADWFPIVDGVVTAARLAVPARAASSAAAVPAAAAAAVPTPTVSAPAAAPAPVVAAAAVAASEHTIAPLGEETVIDPVEPIPAAIPAPALGAPVIPAPSSPAPSGGQGDDEAGPGDHDGLTIASVDIRRLRAEREAAKVGGSTPAPADDTEHAEPQAPQPQLRMPDGSLEAIGHELVLGRAPSVSKVSGGRLPRLVTIGHGDPDISRSHVRMALEGGTVVITDLHSRNGTLVVAPGMPPVKLRAGEPTPVLIGTVVDLGGGCTLQVVGG
ncbi:FHA domain-containing protein [Agromyces neolithicus]|uniref:FHA domain-containing protein n=1 Tax=Agromyces neolithicus TaxID=269420 RepID=A0ABP4YHX6_9MICO